MVICVFFFFFKQKTAYEMRISDWSSDVCSSDLRAGEGKMMSVYVFGSAAAGTAFLSRVHCHLSRCMGAGLLALAVLLVAEPARANPTLLASDSAQVDCQASAKDLPRLSLVEDAFAVRSKIPTGRVTNSGGEGKR